MRHGPKRVAFFFAKIEKRSPIVTGGVRTPARDVEIAPPAVARARVGDHQRISAVAEQLNAGNRSVFIEHSVFRRRWPGEQPHCDLIRWEMNEHRRHRRYALE